MRFGETEMKSLEGDLEVRPVAGAYSVVRMGLSAPV